MVKHGRMAFMGIVEAGIDQYSGLTVVIGYS